LLDPEVFRHTELIDGEILDVPPMSRRHAFTTNKLARRLTVLAVSGEGVGCQTPVVLSDFSEPEPDVWVSRRDPTTAEETKPEPMDLVLVVEVADSSIASDRKVKIPAYARAGVPLVWLAHVGSRTITVYSEPADGRYAVTTIFREGQAIPTPIGGEIAVESVFLK
jgi:Uma2 family endonuclease